MKLYAVVIGRKGRNLRYVAYHPEIHLNPRKGLAVYETREKARLARKLILDDCGHKDVHVITFEDGN